VKYYRIVGRIVENGRNDVEVRIVTDDKYMLEALRERADILHYDLHKRDHGTPAEIVEEKLTTQIFSLVKLLAYALRTPSLKQIREYIMGIQKESSGIV